MTVPPYARWFALPLYLQVTSNQYSVACIFTILAGYFTDKFQSRGIYMLAFELMAISGFTMLALSSHPATQYAGTFLATCGIYPLVPMGVAWNGNNIGGSLKRGVGIAMHVGFGNLGGIISAFCFLPQYEPRFVPGHVTLAGTTAMSALLTAGLTWWLRKENARREKWARDTGMRIESYTEAQKQMERKKGDDATFFRYTV